MNAFRKIVTFVKTLGRDTRGDDATEKSWALTGAGKTVGAACGVSLLCAGVVTTVNNSNSASDHTGKQINGAIGAQAQQTDQGSKPFAVK